MARLKNRNLQIPGGMKYTQPGTNWQSPNWASFDQIVQGIVAHRRANPSLLAKGWSVDPEAVANELDQYQAAICAANGWTDYITGGAETVPFSSPNPSSSLLHKGQRLVAGANILVNWLASKEEAVPITQASKRASICAGCKFNEKGDWESWFTRPVAAAVRREIQKRTDWKLETPDDDKITVCSLCLCPLPLKVHTPLSLILKHLPPNTKASLPPHCWIVQESQ